MPQYELTTDDLAAVRCLNAWLDSPRPAPSEANPAVLRIEINTEGSDEAGEGKNV